MRSKSEILKEATSGSGCAYYDGSVYDGEVGSIEDAMDIFSKEVAIEFAEWRMHLPPDALTYVVPAEPIPRIQSYTPTELFNQFLQQLKQS